MPAVSQADLERWKAFGGSYQESNGRKTYTAPSGKKFKSWKEAEQLMKQDSEMENAGVMRLVLNCGGAARAR